MTPSALTIAQDYTTRRGWRTLPIPFREKAPRVKNWQALRLDAADLAQHFNGTPQNIGVLLGEPSGWLIDVDLDHPEAVALAADYLPPTEATFGRASNRTSHRLYRVTRPIETTKFQTASRKMLAEVRSTGAQTVFPGSTHTSSESIEWEGTGEPALIDPDELLAAVRQLAADVAAKIGEPIKGEAARSKPTTPAPTSTAGGMERARRYMATLPPAIDGQGGHPATFRTACELMRFGLTDSEAMELLREYNSRCSPAWTEKELAHKLADARKEVEARGEVGVRLRDDRRQRSKAAADTPHEREIARSPVMLRLADVKPQPIRWLWEPRIALGKLTLIAGDPGLGKSFLTLDLASRVSTGNGWPDRPGDRFEPGGVVLLSAEDDTADTVVPRLLAAGADLSRMTALRAVRNLDPETGATLDMPFCLAGDLPVLAAAIDKTEGCRLVIVDPISAYLGRTDSHNNSEVRGLLAPLSDLAADKAVAIVAVTHLNKGQGSAIYRAMGSLAFTAAVRAVWSVSRDKDDPNRRLFTMAKNNLAHDGSGLAFGLTDSGNGIAQVGWEAEPINMTADEALADPRDSDGGSTDRAEAADWLKDMLAAGGVSAKEIRSQGSDAGYSWATIRRAKSDAGAVAVKSGMAGGWEWRLPR